MAAKRNNAFSVNGFVVVDPYRKVVPLPPVIVLVYPQIRDMILVKGSNDEIWHAEIRCVLFAYKLVKGDFYIKH